MKEAIVGVAVFVVSATLFGVGFFAGVEFGAYWEHADFILHMISMAH
jgi:hypothetical protein